MGARHLPQGTQTTRGTHSGRTAEFEATRARVLKTCRTRPVDVTGPEGDRSGEILAAVAALCLDTDGPTTVSDVVDATDLTAARARVVLRTARKIIREQALADHDASLVVGAR